MCWSGLLHSLNITCNRTFDSNRVLLLELQLHITLISEYSLVSWAAVDQWSMSRSCIPYRLQVQAHVGTGCASGVLPMERVAANNEIKLKLHA